MVRPSLAPVPKTVPPAGAGGERVFASPRARAALREAGVALATAFPAGSGRGPRGRVLFADVEAFLAGGGAQAAVSAAPAAGAAGEWATDHSHSQMRRVIASRLAESKREVPHYQLSVDVELDALLEARQGLNAAAAAGDDGAARLGVNDFLVKAAALALMRVPEVNSSWGADAVRRYHYADVAVAVAVPDGLVTPVVRDADTKGVGAIAADVRALVDKARAGGLAPTDYEGGTFTISNLGMFGVRTFNAIINPPQAAILAVGAAERRVLPDVAAGDDGGDPYRVATVMSATLSCDHRVVDGAVGAQWLAEFKGLLERPLTMLL